MRTGGGPNLECACCACLPACAAYQYPPLACSLPTPDAAKAFRELRVRPGRTGSGPVDGEGGGRGGAGAAPLERPSSPKKRKASYNIDKEFILKDDKVKRNAGMGS